MRAATITGLALQARAASLENAEIWGDPELDPSAAAVKGLIESLCGYAGVVPVPVEH